MKSLCLYLLLFTFNYSYAQVGIGTVNPSPNAALDINSTTKGLMLPRIADTANVANPSAGLMIYNNTTKKPSFHNGVSWQTLVAQSSSTTSNTDSITYTISGASGIFVNGTFPILALSNGSSCSIPTGGGGGSGPSSLSDINITKLFDANSIAINRAVLDCNQFNGMGMEFNIFHFNSSTPYFSIKIQDVIFSSYSIGVSTDFNFSESVSITGEIIGFKDWVNNKSFGYNLETQAIGSY